MRQNRLRGPFGIRPLGMVAVIADAQVRDRLLDRKASAFGELGADGHGDTVIVASAVAPDKFPTVHPKKPIGEILIKLYVPTMSFIPTPALAFRYTIIAPGSIEIKTYHAGQ